MAAKQPVVFRDCLRILEFEAKMSGLLGTPSLVSGNGDKELLKLLGTFLSTFKTSDLADCLQVVPHLFSAFIRILSKAISFSTLTISNPATASAFLAATAEVLSRLSASHQNDEVKLAFESNKAQLQKFLLILIGTLELSKSAGVAAGLGSADLEVIVESSLTCLRHLIRISAPENSDSGQATSKLNLSGTSLAQVIHISLHFSQHSSKTIAEHSLDLLSDLMSHCSSSVQDWRSFIPGIYSGLFVVCTSGYKRGSHVLYRAFLNLVDSLKLVCKDSLPENIAYRVSSVCGGDGDGDGDGSDSAASSGYTLDENSAQGYMNSWLRRTGSVTAVVESKQDVSSPSVMVSMPASTATAAAAAAGHRLDTVDVPLDQWRVDLLQRVCAPLGVAFRDVFSLCSPGHQVAILNCVHGLLSDCRGFLGLQMFVKLFVLLFSATDCPFYLVRNASMDHIAQLVDRERRLGSWASVASTLMDKWGATVSVIGRLVSTSCGVHSSAVHFQPSTLTSDAEHQDTLNSHLHSDGEKKLELYLSTAVGCATVIKNDVSIAVEAGSRQAIRVAQLCLLPDFESACKSLVLESRRFYFLKNVDAATKSRDSIGSESFLDGGYYRAPYFSSRLNECKRGMRRLSAQLGKYGSLGAVIDDAFSAFLKVEKEIDEISGGRRIDSRMRLSRIRGLASMLYVLQCSLLGAVHIPSSESQTSLHAARLARLSANNQKSRVCALCAVTGDRLSRCGGCKAVYYCSPSHQKAHWIDHKAECKKIANPDTYSPKSSADVDPNWVLQDSCDPLDVPCSVLFEYSAVNICFEKELLEIETNRVVDLCYKVLLWYLCASGHSAASPSSRVGGASPTRHQETAELVGLSLTASSALEVLSDCAFLLQSNFTRHLQQILYIMFELSVSEDAIVKSAAVLSLQRISRYTGHLNTQDLVRCNLDYIVDVACSELRGWSQKAVLTAMQPQQALGVDSQCSTHLVVNAVFNMVGLDSFANTEDDGSRGTAPLVLLKDMVLDVLESVDTMVATGNHSQQNASSAFSVLKVLVTRSMDCPEVTPSASRGGNPALESLISFRDALRKMDEETDKMCFDSEPAEDRAEIDSDDGVESEEEKDSDPSPALQLILDVLNRCTYFLSSKTLRHQVMIVDVISAAMIRLASVRKVFLPAVHKAWPALMNRISQLRDSFVTDTKGFISWIKPSHQSNPPANKQIKDISEAQSIQLLPSILNLLEHLVESCEDFFSIKFQDDLWPELLVFQLHVFHIELSRMNSRSNPLTGKLKTVSKDLLSPSKYHSNPRTLSRSDLVIVDIEPDSKSSSLSGNEVGTHTSSSSSSSSSSSMHSPTAGSKPGGSYEKALQSILKFWRKSLSVAGFRFYASQYVGVLAFLLVPLLGSHQSKSVHEEVHQLLKVLMECDGAFVDMIISSLTTGNQSEMWTSVITYPLLASSFGSDRYQHYFESSKSTHMFVVNSSSETTLKEFTSVPNSLQMRKVLTADDSLKQRLLSVRQCGEISDQVLDEIWVKSLQTRAYV